jgi:hypothetical protein
MNPSLEYPGSAVAPSSANGLWVALGVWFTGSVAAAALGLLQALPPVAVPLFIWSPVLAIAVAMKASPRVRSAVEAVPTSWMILFHSLRAPIGAAFLLLEARGLLSAQFALPAGYGDIAAGLLAMPAAWAAARGKKTPVLLWNLLGAVDILLVFVTAQRILLFGEGPSALRAFFLFPGPVTPLFIVPLVLLTHGLIFQRVRRTQSLR